MKIRFLLLSLFVFLTVSVFAQEGGIKGRVVSRQGRNPIDGATVTLTAGSIRVTQSQLGEFEFPGLQPGNYEVLFEAWDFQPVRIVVSVEDFMKDIGIVSMAPEYIGQSGDDIDFADLDMETGDYQSMPVVLSASKDVYDNIAGYKFSSMRFRIRGYESEYSTVYVNGIRMNDAMTGYTPWSLWTGLNEATRNQELTSGLAISDFGPGDIGGSTNINARASQMRKGFRASVVNANNNYRFRLMATYASGEMDNGWSYAVSASTRQGGNDWINGLYNNSWAYFFSAEKKINLQHRLAFTFFGAPQERAAQQASTDEVYKLVGSNYYNPNWGYQGGRSKTDQRNARIRKTHEPIAMLNYYYDPTSRFNLTASVSFRFGKNGYSALDWYDAEDPRPDYYRNLPSYYEQSDPYKAAWLREGWKSDWNIRQINWEKMYNVNRTSYFDQDVNYYNKEDVTGLRRSKYIIEQRRTDQRDLNAKLQLTTLVGDNGRLSAGYEFRWNRTEYFKVVKDLLGGDYYLDVDQFAERDFGSTSAIQNNLDKPNRMVKKGDKFGYDYYAHFRSEKLWATYKMSIQNFELEAGLETGHTLFWRQGLWRKGLFPDNSKGNSEKQNFWTYTTKLGLNYRITGTQMVYANVAYLEKAPHFNQSFVSPRTRNTVVPNLTTEKIFSADINYAYRTPDLRFRITGFYTRIKDRTDILSFYSDIDRAYTNFALSGIEQTHVGVEFGVAVPIAYGISAEGAVSYGYYIYSSNPNVTQTVDNSDNVVLDNVKVYWKDMKIDGTPQTAVNVGLRYRGPKNIFAGVDLNYFNAMYISMNPVYRTDVAHQYLTAEQSRKLAHQERFDHSFQLNANVGKSWYIKNYNLGFSLEVRNILNDKNIRTGGYEQLRIRRVDSSSDIYERFDSKYFYLIGTSYYLNIYFRF